MGRMLAYARESLTDRRALWPPAVGCALLAAVPGFLAATVLAPALVILLLSGDPVLAFTMLPGPLTHADASGLVAWGAVGLGALVALAIWSRLFALAVWTSDRRNDSSWGAARRATAQTWPKVFLLYLQAEGVILGVAGVMGGLAALAGGGPAGFATVAILSAAAFVVLLRTVVRIFLTLAVRAVVIDNRGTFEAWRNARAIGRERRRHVAAAWMALAAIGVLVWVGGRAISPVLQQTAFDYPSESSYTVAREGAQILLAVPLEAVLMALTMGVWTAVYLGIEPEPARPRAGRREREPWLLRALVAILVLAVVSNALPTVVDAAWARRTDRRLAAIEGREIEPIDALRAVPEAPAGARSSYRVDAALRDEELAWTTTIDYHNDTGETLTDVGLHIYPLAYERRLSEIPLASDLFISDLSGAFRSHARPGEVDVTDVRAGRREVSAEPVGTSLTIELPKPLPAGHDERIVVDIVAELPRFPERFGVWGDFTLLGNWIPTVAVRAAGHWRLDDFGSIGDPFFSDVADYSVDIETDEHLSVVGTGVLTAIEGASEDRRTWHFEAPATRDAAFALSPFLRGLETHVRGTIVRSWYLGAERLRGAANAASATSAVAYYTDRYGSLPFDEVEVVETQGLLGGMEYPGVVFASTNAELLEGVPLLPELVQHVRFDDAQARYLAGHEIAHQWWYATVGSDQVNEPWLDEALAEVSTRLWLRNREGNDRTWRITNLEPAAHARAGVMRAGVDDFVTNGAYTGAVYLGGAQILMDLRARVGPAIFDRILRTWFESEHLKIGSVDELIEVVERVGGPEAGRFLKGFGTVAP